MESNKGIKSRIARSSGRARQMQAALYRERTVWAIWIDQLIDE
jgi:hypothetical protein